MFTKISHLNLKTPQSTHQTLGKPKTQNHQIRKNNQQERKLTKWVTIIWSYKLFTHIKILTYTVTNLESESETHAKGEGSTKSAILRGPEPICDSRKGGGPSSFSSSSSLYSVMVMLVVAVKGL